MDTNNDSLLEYDLARYPIKDTIKMMTFLLEKVIKANDNLYQPSSSSNNSELKRKNSSHHTTCFHARSIPSITIHAYLMRILKYCPCSNECFLALLVYFDRMSKPSNTRAASIRIDSYNIHRLIISGIMVASKLFSDVFFTNTRYAKVGGLPVSELNMLELEFLSLNDFSLFVSLEELQHYGDQLLSHWTKEQQNNNTEKNEINEIEELSAPVRRRARHLSIDKHEDDFGMNNHNENDKINERPT
ncbi:cyclin-domain-containing protein [Cokeromyces recurvatus]|uniref:cyclin-domain-containing protein n=1 Tax=Cokeromyces recurvatus TaxID=90255 RepID=UPI002220566C|nr:cyclin-domain-containing protein [Cokeromyces recurvatus]KAI7897883.1 cyclin-domain-containing protein [Cokeromyces recurvatus]